MIYLKLFDKFSKTMNNKMIAYHGTPHGEFDKFSMKKRGSGADLNGVGDYGKGFYFSPSKEYALSYATEVANRRNDIKNNNPTLYTVELEMNKPFDMRILSNIQNKYIELVKKYGAFNIPDEEYQKMYDELGITEEDEEFYREIENLIGDNWGDWDIKNKLKERGYDSLINYDGNEYVVYSPNQIKILNIEVVSDINSIYSI
jgi:hypothetical protein